MFAFLIFDCGRDIEAIKDVVMAVTTGMKQVVQIFVLVLLLGYVGAILLYLYLNNYPPDDDEPERHHLCSEGHLLSCMFLLVRTGFEGEEDVELEHISKNLAYQWVMYIVFGELISAIVFSAITNGFDELRGKKEEVRTAQPNTPTAHTPRFTCQQHPHSRQQPTFTPTKHSRQPTLTPLALTPTHTHASPHSRQQHPSNPHSRHATHTHGNTPRVAPD